LAEQRLRRSLFISHGDPLIFLKRPISVTLIVIAVFMMISAYYRIKKSMKREEAAQEREKAAQHASTTDGVHDEYTLSQNRDGKNLTISLTRKREFLAGKLDLFMRNERKTICYCEIVDAVKKLIHYGRAFKDT
jgi:hypothetical protein